MKVKRIVANITTDDSAAAQRFYGDVLGHGRWEEDEDHTNALGYATYHDTPWTEIGRRWRARLTRFLETVPLIAVRNLLDSGECSG